MYPTLGNEKQLHSHDSGILNEGKGVVVILTTFFFFLWKNDIRQKLLFKLEYFI